MLLEVNANPSMRIEHEQEVRPLNMMVILEWNCSDLVFWTFFCLLTQNLQGSM